MADATITAKQLAQRCETDPKTFRRFLRSHFRGLDQAEALPGQGGRYVFTKAEARSLQAAFLAQKTAPKKVTVPDADEDGEVEDFDVDSAEAELEALILGETPEDDEDSDEDEEEEDSDEEDSDEDTVDEDDLVIE